MIIPSENIFIKRWGPPDRWTCPDCGVRFDIYPALPFDHLCSSQIRYSPKKVYYFLRGDSITGKIQFCITGDHSPGQYVRSLTPQGEFIIWDKRSENDLIVFQCPDGWDYSKGLDWQFDKRFQYAKPLPPDEADKMALRGRVSG